MSVRRHPNAHAAFAAAHPLDAGPLVTSIDVTFFSPEGGPKDDIYKRGIRAHGSEQQ